MAVDHLRQRVEHLEGQLRQVSDDLHGLAAIAQVLARLEAVVDGIRIDLNEMKQEWQRIRERVHKLENDQVGGSAAAEALKEARKEAAQAKKYADEAERTARESDAAGWSRRTRKLLLFVACCGGVGGLVGAAIGIYTVVSN